MKYFDTDWKNIKLDTHEIEEKILEPYTFESLLLEIYCGLPIINEDTVKKHFNEQLNAKIREAKEIFSDNLQNIVKHALKERNKE